MNFAKNLLSKYGWKEGEGLGRNNDGITKPVKANYKYDNTGLGHNKADDLNNHWWENVYNQAASNLDVQKNETNEILVGLKNEKSVEISTKNYLVKNLKKEKDVHYGGLFMKSATLTNDGQEVEHDNKPVISPLMLKIVSDEELFKACGGRTAHKGARHGLKLSGKLNRIAEQEQELAKKMESTMENCSELFKNYVDRKSRQNARQLKRLNRRKSKKLRRKERRMNEISSALASTWISDGDDKTKEEKKEEKEEENEKHKVKLHKSKIANGKVEKKTKEKTKRLKKSKKIAKLIRVADSKDNFLKKITIEEVPISFNFKSKKHDLIDSDNASLKSYRGNDDAQSHSDNDNEIQNNIRTHLSETLRKVKKKKQKVIVENLTEFQMEHLRKADVPFVEIKQSSRKKCKKDRAKVNNLVSNLVDKMNIL